ncbi:hypothetical protein M404DRAFT_31207 [Pisolithus tinctorius Marx 270]|uniref:Uncharacterized protein n=1 Tax=Pisolithus tinctorius Marx 270 TaxID=870435 RepID=A0A0C3INH4_PISTI|nr:hypothetical protein M404DRAFT_31207 [Pisolithus tinctorius Marx 270]
MLANLWAINNNKEKQAHRAEQQAGEELAAESQHLAHEEEEAALTEECKENGVKFFQSEM